jgi:CRP-like cAMP-binding protein
MKGGTVVESIERVVAEHPFFAGVDQALLTQIVDSASHVKFDAGTYIFKEGDQANTFYLIRDGRVALEIVAPGHKPITVDTLEGGDTLGWSWLLSPFHLKFSAYAKTGVRAIALDAKSIRAKCEENRDLGYEVLNRLAFVIERRLDATRFQLLDVYGGQVSA